jgi:hypothetical protein
MDEDTVPPLNINPLTHEEERKRLLAKGEVSLLLDTYEDIFSDFDPRPFHSRALSVDFLEEATRATRESEGSLQLHFLIPKTAHNIDTETVIRKRLHEHFRRHYDLLHKEYHDTVFRGILITLLGFILMFAATYVNMLELKTFLMYLLITFLEPAGWFTVWSGLDIVFFHSGSRKTEYDFYKKMVNVEIKFDTY